MKNKKIIAIVIFVIVTLIALIVVISLFVSKDKNTNTENSKSEDNTKEKISIDVSQHEKETFSLDESLVMYENDELPTDDDTLDCDFDLDSLRNEEEQKYGTDIYKFDTDEDGISDYDEIYSTKTDPLLWSSRDDGMSDMDYIIIEKNSKKRGWDGNLYTGGFAVYIENEADVLWDMRVVEDEAFDMKNKISQVYIIDNFTGKVGFCYSGTGESEVANLNIYVKEGDTVKKIEVINDTENKMITFEVVPKTIFCATYEGGN